MINITEITKSITQISKWPKSLLLAFVITFFVLYFVPFPDHTALFRWRDGAAFLFFSVMVMLRFFEEKKSKKTFQLTPSPNQNECLCVIAKQPDGRFCTDFRLKFNAKNITEKPISLTRAEIVKPSIPGDIACSSTLVRHKNKNEYGSVESGYFIQPSQVLPASIFIATLSHKKCKFKKKFQVILNVYDDENNRHKIKAEVNLLDLEKGGLPTS